MISLQKIITKLKSLIDKNTADITALNNGLTRYTYKWHAQALSNQSYIAVKPPDSGYLPAAVSNADYDLNHLKVTGLSWQPSRNAAIVWFDNNYSGDVRVNILWVKGTD